jgi:hypothetical protein
MKRWLLFLTLATSACDSRDVANPNHLEGALTMELRDKLAIVIDIDPAANTLRAQLTPSAGYDVLPAATLLQAHGIPRALPETGAILYTAKLELPAIPNGPCGSEPISAALSLHRQAGSATVMGGLSVYCGAATWHGVPVRVLRLAGDLPIPSTEPAAQ